LALSVRKTVRTLGHRLGLVADYPPPNGECGADWYDRAYRDTEGYHAHYTQSPYYFLWMVIVDRIRRSGLRRVLEIGCGPGQMAALLIDQGIDQYVGLDFSLEAIAMAQRNVPRGRFVVGDARTSEIHAEIEHDVIICTEVLEHIEDDLQVLARFGVGKRCLCSVPNFPYESHVRHFRDAEDVAARYGGFFDSLDVMTFKSPKSPLSEYFLLDGVRNDRLA
jgi:trans-aconitate methyltransferase